MSTAHMSTLYEQATTIPERFGLAHHSFTLQTLEALHLPPFKGSALRGGFGHAFKRLACREPRPCDDHCHRGTACAYGYIFETTPPEDSEVLSKLSEIPRPFVIQSPGDQRPLLQAGERLVFRLVLVGHAVEYLPYFVAVFRELGRVGLGRSRGQYHLAAVSAKLPDETEIPIYAPESDGLPMIEATLTSAHIHARAETLSANQITLEFLMPALIRHGGDWVTAGPPFQALVQALTGRVSSLSYFHCGSRWEIDFRTFIDRAAEIAIAKCETEWQDWSRFSGRQHQRVEMGGLVGCVTYEGDLRTYLPLLVLGESVHVGKGTVFGNGQYRIIS